MSAAGSGAKTGADWSNTLAFPASWVRGDVYYLADGTYAKFTFSTAASGTSTVELRKAKAGDHCTDTGWNAGTMGSSQAVFPYSSSNPIVGVSASYLTLNGNGSYAAPGCGGAGTGSSTQGGAPPTPADCGIKIDNSLCTTATPDACDYPVKVTGASITNLTMKYVEVLGTQNTNASANTAETMQIFAPYSGDSLNSYTHLFMHDAGCVYIQDGQQGESVSWSYFWGNMTNSGGCHGQASFSDGAESNTTYANNIFRDISGTSIWTFASASTTHDSWTFYNNVIWNDSYAQGEQEDGIIACINSGTICTNFMVVQNAMIDLDYNTGTVFDNAGGSITFENNIWYLNETTGATLACPAFTMNGSTLAEDYNSCLASGTGAGGLAGGHDVIDNSSPNPFANWSGGNFSLASENTDWSNRATLSSPLNSLADLCGNVVFSSDRGPCQFESAAAGQSQASAGVAIAPSVAWH